MDNAAKGDVSLKAGGVTYTLRFTYESLVRLEEEGGIFFTDVIAELTKAQRVGAKLTRALLHASLLQHHPEIELPACGDIIMKAGGILPVFGTVTKAMQLAFPSSEARGKPRPPKGEAPKLNRRARRARKQ